MKCTRSGKHVDDHMTGVCPATWIHQFTRQSAGDRGVTWVSVGYEVRVDDMFSIIRQETTKHSGVSGSTQGCDILSKKPQTINPNKYLPMTTNYIRSYFEIAIE